jgi:hypothetical protein
MDDALVESSFDSTIHDGHARWAAYQTALGNADRHPDVLIALRDDPDRPLVSAVVVLALEMASAEARPSWVAVLPEGPERDFAHSRAHELGLLETFSSDARTPIDAATAETWSPWLQRRLAREAAGANVLSILAESGSTKRIRSDALRRLSAV